MANTKKSLIFSALSLLLCCALLAGTTFAWFTDSVTNAGNIITAGNLAINAYAYDIGEGGESFTITGVNNSMEFTFEADAQAQDLKEENCPPIISDDLWEPGKSNAKLLKVENAGTLAVKIKLDFETAGDLTDALWFDFIQVKSGEVTGSFTKRPMNTLSTFAKDLELPIIAKGDKLEFILVYGMYEEAGNEYKETDFTANVSILAAQYTYEKDGFDNTDYDKNPVYPVASASALSDAIKTGGTIVIGQDISYDETSNPDIDTNAARNTITKPTVIDLSGNTVSLDSGKGNSNWAAFYLSGRSANVTVNGDGKIEASATTGAYCFHLSGSLFSRPTLTINGGTYAGQPTAVNVQFGTAYINGGFFDCGPAGTVDEDKYRYTLNCIDDNYDNGWAKIIVTGGTFVNFNPADNQAEGPGTNFVAEGYKVISEEQPDGDVWYTVVPE